MPAIGTISVDSLNTTTGNFTSLNISGAGSMTATNATIGPVTNAVMTNPVRIINNTPASNMIVNAVPASVGSLSDRVFVCQGGSQTSMFMACVKAAQLGAHVYVLSRTKFWFRYAVERYNNGAFPNNASSPFVDASENGLFKPATMVNYGTDTTGYDIVNDTSGVPTVTFADCSGFIKWIRSDARIPNIAYADKDYKTRAGYVDPSGSATPWLSELMLFTKIDTNSAIYNTTESVPLTIRGALGYIKAKEGKITDISVMGGVTPYSRDMAGALFQATIAVGTNYTLMASNFAPFTGDYIGMQSCYDQIVQYTDDNPMGRSRNPVFTYAGKYGARSNDIQTAQQLLSRCAFANEAYKMQLNNTMDPSGGLSGAFYPLRFGFLSSNSGKEDVDGFGDFVRYTPYNMAWKLSNQLNKQMAVEGYQMNISSFSAGVGGLMSKTIGPFYFMARSWSFGKALDLTAFTNGSGVVIVDPSSNHVKRLLPLTLTGVSNPDYDAAYNNLHNHIKFDNSGNALLKNMGYNNNTLGNFNIPGVSDASGYLADTTINTNALTDASGILNGSWIYVKDLESQLKLNAIYTMSHYGLLTSTDTMSVFNRVLASSLSKPWLHFVPLARFLEQGSNTWYMGIMQKGGLASGTMSPKSVGLRMFDCFFNNNPVTTGEYIDIDASAYNASQFVTSNPYARFDSNSTNGLMDKVLPYDPNKGILTQSEWKELYQFGSGYAFDSPSNIYNVGNTRLPPGPVSH